MMKIENLSYRHKNSGDDVLKGLHVHFKAGKLHVILVPPDSSKTALLSVMTGLDMPTEGSVSIDGDCLTTADLNLLRQERVAVIYQAFHLFPLLTALENVCYPMEQSGMEKQAARRKAKELLESVGISEDRHGRYPAHLSGGEQQRAAIARALSTGARVILADEPTGNLDADNSEVIIAILRHLAHKQGYCVIIFTQDSEIAQISDAVYRMSDGTIRRATL